MLHFALSGSIPRDLRSPHAASPRFAAPPPPVAAQVDLPSNWLFPDVWAALQYDKDWTFENYEGSKYKTNRIWFPPRKGGMTEKKGGVRGRDFFVDVGEVLQYAYKHHPNLLDEDATDDEQGTEEHDEDADGLGDEEGQQGRGAKSKGHGKGKAKGKGAEEEDEEDEDEDADEVVDEKGAINLAKLSKLDADDVPGDVWAQLWEKLQELGWHWEIAGGSALHSSNFFRPDSKDKKSAVKDVDYFTSKKDVVKVSSTSRF